MNFPVQYLHPIRNYVVVGGRSLVRAVIVLVIAVACDVNADTALLPAPDAVRFLNQATFGANDRELAKVQQRTFAGWLEEQFAMSVDKTYWDRVLADQNAWLAEDATRSSDKIPQATCDWSVWEAYLTAPDQLRKRIGFALSQIMVVSLEGLSGNGRTRSLLAAAYLDVLERNVFGNFRALLEDVALNPAMGQYLSHRGNRKADYPRNDPTQAPRRVPDENFAREVMQLFSIGLYELNPNGTVKLFNKQPRETYTQADVQGLARVFTGWDWEPRSDADFPRKPMQHIANRHSLEEKRFLGVTIPAATDGPTSLRIALDTLFQHPNTGPFITKQLIQRLVTSNPTPAYVARVAAIFADNGAGVRGDMKAVINAILLDREARSTPNLSSPAPTVGKLREPVLRFSALARALDIANAGEIWHIGDLSNPATALGQSPLHSPSVFNFYRPGYVPPNTPLAELKLVAPEFQITTDTSVPGIVNYLHRVLVSPPKGLTLNLDRELRLVDNAQALVDRTNLMLANGAIDDANRALILRTIAGLPANTSAQRLRRARAAILMTLASPEFMVQK